MNKKLALGIFILIIAFLIIGYLQIESPKTLEGKTSLINSKDSFPISMTQSQPGIPAKNTKAVGSVESMIDGLRKRLENEPNDVKGWVLLAKSYQFLQQPNEAQKALEKAKTLGYTGDDISVQNAESKSPHADLITSTADKKMYQYIGETADDKNSVDPIAATSTGVNVKVSLAKTLGEQLNPETTLFIFARPANQSAGPPLAVVRKQVKDLPFTITLNDSLAMMPGRTISSATDIVVVARISLSGSPTKQAGDIEVISQSITSNTTDRVDLEINN